MRVKSIAVVVSMLFATQGHAQVSTAGALVIVPATGQVTHANDEATVTFSAEETGRDKAAVASLINKKMKLGAELVRAQDGSAKLETQNYNTFAVYKKMKDPDSAEREIIGWRVVQSLEVTTKNLVGLPKMASAAQGTLGLTSISFHLSDAVSKKLDDQRIAASYQNLNERIASIAGAMGRKPSDATLEAVDFEGAERGQFDDARTVRVSGRRSRIDVNQQVAEPSFEPGETTLDMRVVGKVKFK